MTAATSVVGQRTAQVPHRLAPMRFVIAFGVVSMLADFVYESARDLRPYGATFGASAALVGFIAGAGEAGALAALISLAGGRRVASTRQTEADGP